MSDPGRPGGPTDSLRGYAWLLAALWTGAVAASLGWTLHVEWRDSQALALENARNALDKDATYRRWMSGHGGIYVYVIDGTRPSEYLRGLPERDVVTPLGQLTLISPAHICREVYEIEAETSGVRSHMTSLRPIRRENAPDPWEREALGSFERGEMEATSAADMEGAPYMRLMRPLVTEPQCLYCHAGQGYQVGDVRGGISVSVPVEPVWSMVRRQLAGYSAAHGMLWLLGLGGIALGAKRAQRQAARRRQTESELREKDIRLRTMAEREARLEAERVVLLTNQKLEVARQIQEKILPDAVPVLPGLQIAGFLHSADATSGDFYDYLAFSDGSLGMVIADVSGHGIGPALVAVETCAYLRALAAASCDVGDILTSLNDYLCRTTDDGRFVTLLLARVDLRTHTLVFASAGHSGYLLDPDGTVTLLEATSPPLGVLPELVIPCSAPLRLAAGQILALVTDGVLEATNGAGESFGASRAIDLIRARREAPAGEIAAALFDAVRHFVLDEPQEDDVTVLVLKVVEPAIEPAGTGSLPAASSACRKGPGGPTHLL
jgi:serine phosphatase RsbU (regulator of sigma subunit)